MVTSAQRFDWDETPWIWDKGFGKLDKPEFHVVAIDYGIKRNILRLLAGEGCKVTVVTAKTSAEDILAMKPDGVVPVERSRRSGRRPAPTPCPSSRKSSSRGHQHSVFVSAHQMLGPRARRQDRENASGPSRRQSSGQGRHHRQGGNHLDEPRFAVTRRRCREKCRADACLAVRQFKLWHRAERQPVFSVQYHPEASPGPRDSHYLFRRFSDLMRAKKRA